MLGVELVDRLHARSTASDDPRVMSAIQIRFIVPASRADEIAPALRLRPGRARPAGCRPPAGWRRPGRDRSSPGGIDSAHARKWSRCRSRTGGLLAGLARVARRRRRAPSRAAGSGGPIPSSSITTSDFRARRPQDVEPAGRVAHRLGGVRARRCRGRPPAGGARRARPPRAGRGSSRASHGASAGAARSGGRPRGARTGRRAGRRSDGARGAATCAAASSMASGIPSSRRADLRDVGRARPGDIAKSGCTSGAAVANSCTASDVLRRSRSATLERRDRVHLLALAPRAASRLVARTDTVGQRSRISSTSAAQASMTCSQLSTTSSTCASARKSISSPDGSPEPVPRARRENPTADANAAGHDRDVRDRREVDEEHPVREPLELLGRGLDREPRLAATTHAGQRHETLPLEVLLARISRSSSRPTKVVRCAGRLWRTPSERSGGKSSGRSGWSSWYTRSARARSRSRCSPRSRRDMPPGSAAPSTSSLVALAADGLPAVRDGAEASRRGSARCRGSRPSRNSASPV